MSRRVPTLLLALLASLTGAGALAGAAHADPYVVQGCTPGSSGPVGAKLLDVSTTGRADGRFRARDTCSAGGAVEATLRAGKPLRAGDAGRLTLDAGAGSTVTRLTVTRTITVTRPRYEYRLVARVGPTRRGVVLERCNGTDDCAALSAKGTFSGTLPQGTAAVSFELSCRARSGRTCVRVPGNRAAAQVSVKALSASVDDVTPPTIDAANGDLLASGGALTGVQPYRVRASDEGSGLREVALLVDGAVVQRVATTPTPCATGTPGAAACPLTATLTPSFDTAALRNGGHLLVVRVTDAAGNTADSGLAALTTFNPTQTGPFLRLGAQIALTGTTTPVRGAVRYGDPATLSGTVTDLNGTPLANQPVTIGAAGGQATGGGQESYTAVTDAAGAWSVPLRTGSSRRLFVLTKAGAALGAATAVDLEVTPTVSFVVGRLSSKRVRLRGSVPVIPRPDAGVAVNIQAYASGQWRTFKTPRTAPDGSFSTTYAFTGSGRYRFRAVVEEQGGFPFARGISRTRIVDVPRG